MQHQQNKCLDLADNKIHTRQMLLTQRNWKTRILGQKKSFAQSGFVSVPTKLVPFYLFTSQDPPQNRWEKSLVKILRKLALLCQKVSLPHVATFQLETIN